MKASCRASVLGLLLAAGLLVPGVARADFVGLGEAANYVLFDVSYSQWKMQGATVNGAMAAGPYTTYDWANHSGSYTGPVDYQKTVKADKDDKKGDKKGDIIYQAVVPPVDKLGVPNLTTNAIDTVPAILDAYYAANALSILTDSIKNSGGDLKTSTTITGNGGLNLIDIHNVDLENKQVTIYGSNSDYFIFRVDGDFNVSNAVIISADLVNGVLPEHILWYFPNTSTITSNNGTWDGTILALNSGVSLAGHGTAGPVLGAVIAAGDQDDSKNWVFKIDTGFAIDYHPYSWTPASTGGDQVPEPATGLLLGTGLAAIVLIGRKWRPGSFSLNRSPR